MIRYFLVFIMILPSLGWAKRAPVQKPAPTQSQELGLPRGRYITGGVVGSTLGFGVGHAIQKRYAGHAWIFTAAESAAIGYFWMNGLFACDGTTGSEHDSCMSDVNRRLTIAAVTFLGFRMWEAIDVWTGVKVAPDRVALLPGVFKSNTPGVVLALRF